MPARHLDLVSHWRIAAPVDRVWAALADAESWPQWWPHVRSVRTLRQGDAGGLGSVRRIEWATRLARVRPEAEDLRRPPAKRARKPGSGASFPGAIAVEVEVVEALPLERLRCRSRGRLRGEGICLLRSDGRFTDATVVWRVELAKRWMRWLAPVLGPLLRWNHVGVMRAGAIGLARHLGVGRGADLGPSASATP